MVRTPFAWVALLSVSAVLAGRATGAQGVSPLDDKETARFQLVTKAAAAAGYSTSVVVGHGTGTSDALFALLTTKAGKGVLAVMVEPGRTPSKPADLETGQTPAELGVRGIDFVTPFLGVADLFDVEVRHMPFMLETSSDFSIHHLVRRQGTLLSKVCEFRGSSRSSSSKGIGSMSSSRNVTPARGAATMAGAFGFDLVIVDETSQTTPGQPPQTTRQESRQHYDLPATGLCIAAGR